MDASKCLILVGVGEEMMMHAYRRSIAEAYRRSRPKTYLLQYGNGVDWFSTVVHARMHFPPVSSRMSGYYSS